MADAKTRKGFVPKTFRDAGTNQEFEGGKEHDFEVGAYDNYKAAGLVTVPDAKEAPIEAPKGKPTA